MTTQKALAKLEYYCAYQERCLQEVWKKIDAWFLPKEIGEFLVENLQEEGYLDEERFAKHYVSGKFRLKKWGRVKIELELKSRNIPQAYIDQAMESEIEEEDYLETIDALLEKKKATFKGKTLTPAQRHQRLMSYLFQKGYERHLIWQALRR